MDNNRLNALEQQLTDAMRLDSTRDIYFDRHGEDVIRELIAALRLRPEGAKLHEAVQMLKTVRSWLPDASLFGDERKYLEGVDAFLKERS